MRLTCAMNRRIHGPNSTPLVSNWIAGPNCCSARRCGLSNAHARCSAAGCAAHRRAARCSVGPTRRPDARPADRPSHSATGRRHFPNWWPAGSPAWCRARAVSAGPAAAADAEAAAAATSPRTPASCRERTAAGSSASAAAAGSWRSGRGPTGERSVEAAASAPFRPAAARTRTGRRLLLAKLGQLGLRRGPFGGQALEIRQLRKQDDDHEGRQVDDDRHQRAFARREGTRDRFYVGVLVLEIEVHQGLQLV